MLLNYLFQAPKTPKSRHCHNRIWNPTSSPSWRSWVQRCRATMWKCRRRPFCSSLVCFSGSLLIWNHEHDSGRQNTCQRLVRQLPSLQSLLGRQCFLDGVTAHSYVKRKIHAPDMQIISGPDKKRNCEHDESQLHIQHAADFSTSREHV